VGDLHRGVQDLHLSNQFLQTLLTTVFKGVADIIELDGVEIGEPLLEGQLLRGRIVRRFDAAIEERKADGLDELALAQLEDVSEEFNIPTMAVQDAL
jgi:hypothetical protein